MEDYNSFKHSVLVGVRHLFLKFKMSKDSVEMSVDDLVKDVDCQVEVVCGIMLGSCSESVTNYTYDE